VRSNLKHRITSALYASDLLHWTKRLSITATELAWCVGSSIGGVTVASGVLKIGQAVLELTESYSLRVYLIT